MESPRPLLKNRVDAAIEQAVVDLARESPAYSRIRIANEALKRHALTVSPRA